jgi:4-cresol dehydrogenase (hydroxylating)
VSIPISRFEEEVADLISSEVIPQTDLSGHRCRPAGVLVPQNREDVIRIVKAAGPRRAKLHAISCGRNWGFGSALPAKNGTWIVNLSRLNDTSSYDAETGSIRIEPGVTQIDLYRELAQLGGDWFFNVTGAGHTTSVLGNALERGIGYHGQRQLDLIELEVVTGRGEVINTRLGTLSKAPANLGADLTQLFVQTALGVVVAARLQLIRRTDGGGAAIVRLKVGDRASEFFRTILTLKQDGAIAGVPHIANRDRIVTTIAPWLPPEEVVFLPKRTTPWTAALPVTGCREMTEAAFSLIRKRLENFCEVETILAAAKSVEWNKVVSPMEQLHQLASGFPSNLALPSVQWASLGTTSDIARINPESTGGGLIHVTPSIASSDSEIKRALKIVEQVTHALGMGNLPMTVNVVSQSITVLVISICFPAAEAVPFQHKAGILENRFRAEGIMPYRIGLGQEDWIPRASKDTCAVYRRLKEVFDPLKVFAISKYEATHLSRKPILASEGIQFVARRDPMLIAEAA